MKKNKRIVVALGGNALGKTAEEQLNLVKITSCTIVDLVESGHEVIVGHGNGPQVGIINLAMDFSSDSEVATPSMPFPECGAMSQGYIGYHLQQSIGNELKVRGIQRDVVSLVTQTIVDKDDIAFQNPTKPIGMFYTKEESEKISAEKQYKFIEDAGRGYRRVVPSPIPQKIVEIESINKLVNSGSIVIAVGGGGIPVIKISEKLEGIPAVIDKDKSCAKLASELNADVLLILTAVDSVFINFNKDNQKKLSEVTKEEISIYCKEGQFAKGSMMPKIEACIDFLDQNPNGVSIITSLEKAKEAVNGKEGTVIYNKKATVGHL